MNVVSGRLRLGLSAAVATGAFLLALVPVTAAQAAGPEQFKGTETISFTDTMTCGFPIAMNMQDSFVGRVFFDAQGNIQSLTIEQNIVGTASANGVTLPQIAHFVKFNNFSTGAGKEIGLSLLIQGGTVVSRTRVTSRSTRTDQLPSLTGHIPSLKAIPLPFARR